MKPIVLILGLAPLAACAGQLLRLESSLDSMGTTFAVVAYGPDKGRLEVGVEQSLEEVRRLDALLSNYRQRSEWSLINREASKR
ncbi:MAG: FAD:protein FMN transferase, partial [Bryobacteraceae bacterium]